MSRISRLALAALLSLTIALPAAAGVPTAHRISFQGVGRNASNQPVVSGDVRVRIYDAATAGTLVYDSGTEFASAIVTGIFNVVLGGGTALMLDDTKQYHLELDVNGQEVVGDAAAGRQAFWPAGGDLSRGDLESRLTTLEGLVFAACGAGTYNLNGNPSDGCEFTLDASGIYVDANDPNANDNPGCGRGPVGSCANCQPCQSIARGLTEAVSTGRTTVYVANATYNEAVTLVSGKNLLGGFRSGTWERNVAGTATIIAGQSSSGNHRRAVVGAGITSPTLFEGFVVFGPVVTGASGNSYAVYLSNAGSLTVRSDVIQGGIGGPGNDGPAGSAGSDGVAGSPGANAVQSPTSSCSVALNRSGGAGGSLICGVTSVSGGAGGGNQCSPVPNSEASGIDGAAGPGGGGAGGDAGDDSQLQSAVCTPPPINSVNGASGGNGPAGTNGSAGAGGTSGTGTVVGGNWTGPSATTGSAGTFGRGGGGGGAGGGSDGISPERDVLGGAGGGGGSGACGGSVGSIGNSGGGSFGIFVTSGSAPTINSCLFHQGYGGLGGRGGAGGRGGIGGIGAAGGLPSFFCCGAGGRGGDGGAGGHAGGGGGGAGGISCGIFTSGVGTPGYAGLNLFTGGAGGSGGAGGLSFANSGTAGAAGTFSQVTSQ